MIEIVTAGAACHVEDLGTRHRAHLGHSLGGAADMRSLELANRVVGNAPGARGLEVTFSGPTLRFRRDATVAWCGGDWDVDVDGVALTRLTMTHVRAGQRLRIGVSRSGLRLALAVAGGIAAPAVGTLLVRGTVLTVGDAIAARTPWALSTDVGVRPLLEPGPWWLRVTDAPQSTGFTADARSALTSAEFVVTPEASRRGVKLKGPRLHRVDGAREPLSEGVAPGSIQVTHDGDPIVLGVDQTTTGGYAKIACVASVDRWLLGQLRPGFRVRFARVTFDEARRALMAWHAESSSR